MQQELLDTLRSRALTPAEKDSEVTRLLGRQLERGVPLVKAILLESREDWSVHLYNYLSLVPGRAELKSELIRRLLSSDPTSLVLATRCMRELPWRVVMLVIESLGPRLFEPGLRSVLHEIAQYFPQLLHPWRDQISESEIEQLLLPGSDDEVLDKLVAGYTKQGKHQWLVEMAWIRTASAHAFLVDLRRRTRNVALDPILHLAGIDTDGRRLVVFPAYRGFVVAAGEGAHAMGQGDADTVPACDTCGLGSTRLLTLDLQQVMLPLQSTENPTFYAHPCGHGTNAIYVQHTRGRATGVLCKMTTKPARRLLPAPANMVLELQPCEFGSAGWRTPGRSAHQVGGFPSLLAVSKSPVCPQCSQTMNYLLTLDSGASVVGALTFDGVVHGYWCDTCNISASVRQNTQGMRAAT